MTELRRHRLDFDTLSVLAQTDPRSFEELRQQTIADAIARAPEDCRQRLRCLQWRIDRVRQTSRTPMAACITISNMMWSSFHDLNRLYRRLNAAENEVAGEGGSLAMYPRARVLPFRSRH